MKVHVEYDDFGEFIEILEEEDVLEILLLCVSLLTL